ncbi:hypothetical protein AB0J42_31080 [Nonomuraea sp. NPDC049649]|uniref:hypothetical protein n=1 Tax=Nonomuraea sp. NPDC049649 TaxID=3155776 RepID=UPI00343FCD66
MPVEHAGLTAHAEVLSTDARALTACAERLREIGARLEAAGVAPPWLRASVDAHAAACDAAAADLDEAATRLWRYAGEARR